MAGVLARLSPDQRERIAIFERLLIEANRTVNLTAIDDPARIRVRHVEDSLAALEMLRKRRGGRRLVDVGSGAGFPGLILAIALPDWEIVSVEATGKKARFQERAARELALSNVRVLNERAEAIGRDPAHRGAYDVATARAVASLPVLAELLLPLLRPPGCALAWKGEPDAEELSRAEAACGMLGGALEPPIPYVLEDPVEGRLAFSLVPMRKAGECPEHYPRNSGAIRKRPLGGR